MNFKDKVIWITGASSGIGEAMTYAFANAGARLVISSRQIKELQRVRDNCPPTVEVMILPLDVTEMEKIPVAAGQVYEKFGYINMLVANAGVSQRSLARNTDLRVDRKVMEVDYFGTIAMTKAVLPYLINNQFGHIVVISSVMGKIGTPLRSAYAAAKHALHGFFDSLRAEVHEDGIAVTIICPGYVRTSVSINALTGDGSKLNVMSDTTDQGMDPDVFARKALRAIHRERAEVYIGGWEIIAVYVQRYFPWLLRLLIRKVKTS